MRTYKSLISFRKIFIMSLFLNLSQVFAATNYINIATGGVDGVYWPAGGAICRLVNINRKDHGIRCSAESTSGSVANLNSLREGTTDFAIVQSDWQYHSYNGTSAFADQKPFKSLRSVFSLYTETFTIGVLEDSNIKKIDDIFGKKINFGPKGSGMFSTMDMLFKVKGWNKSSFGLIADIEPSKQVKSLCSGKIDVMVYTAGNPNGVLQDATQNVNPKCRVRILSIDKETINKFIKMNPFYVKALIPGGMYRGNPNDIETFGVKATVVTSERTPDEIVYQLTKAVFSNFDDFKSLHPVFSYLYKDSSVKDGNYAPLHPGAIRYYKESGLL